MDSGAAFLVEPYIDHLNFERGLSPLTVDAYRRDLLRFVEFVAREGRPEPRSVAAADVRNYVLHLGGLGLAPTTVRRAQSALRTYFGFLLEEGVIQHDPTEGLASPRVGRPLPDVLSYEEVLKLLEAPSVDSPVYWRDKAILEVLYATGVRVSELVGLKLAALDLKLGLCTVSGKGAKERIVPLGEPARVALRRYLNDVRGRFDRGRSGGHVFLSRTGRGLSRTSIWSLVREAARTAGLDKKVSPHTLRHTFATHLLEGGADLVSVQELLGHVDISTTQIYTHLDRDYLRSVHRKYHPRS